MNANELADKLETEDCCTLDMEAVADTLRQQQAEIEALKYEKSSGVYDEPKLHLSFQKDKETGELLAVTYTDDEHRIMEVLWQKPPAKTLTDEEIQKLHEETSFFGVIDPIKFARAILRKVQEK